MVLGSSGQLGQAIATTASQCVHLSVINLSLYGDILSEVISSQLSHIQPTVIINAAAFTDVERAERDPDAAMAANYHGVAALAHWARLHNAFLVHFSTDYVFNGSGDNPWREEDRPDPLNMYGQSKWLGEQAIVASGCRYLIIRTSWLHSPWRNNFLKTMLHLGSINPELRVVNDQIGAPTSATMLAEMTLLAIERVLVNSSLAGCYHLAASGAVSWYQYADYLFQQAKVMGLIDKIPRLLPVTSAQYPSLVRRPLNSRLDCTRFCTAFDVQLPPWQQGVTETLQQLRRTR